MKAEDVKVGNRFYHAIFGWRKVTHPPNEEDKCLVDLEADEIEYYVMGQGYVSFKRDDAGRNILYTPIADLFKDHKNIPNILYIKKMGYNPKLIFWK